MHLQWRQASRALARGTHFMPHGIAAVCVGTAGAMCWSGAGALSVVWSHSLASTLGRGALGAVVMLAVFAGIAIHHGRCCPICMGFQLQPRPSRWMSAIGRWWVTDTGPTVRGALANLVMAAGVVVVSGWLLVPLLLMAAASLTGVIAYQRAGSGRALPAHASRRGST